MSHEHRLRRLKDHQNAKETWSQLNFVQRWCIRRNGGFLNLGKEKKEGWKDPLSFYLFWCVACEKPAKDFRHGHGDYILCSYCSAQYSFSSFMEAFISAVSIFLPVRTQDKPVFSK